MTDLYKSVDAAFSWTLHGTGLPNLTVTSIIVDQATPAHMFAALTGGLVYASVDSGDTWSLAGDTGDSDIIKLVQAPSDPAVLFAITATAGGVFRSDDSGANWISANGGLATALPTDLVVEPDNMLRVHLSTANEGVFTSVDGGETWGPFDGGTPSLTAKTVALTLVYYPEGIVPDSLIVGFEDDTGIVATGVGLRRIALDLSTGWSYQDEIPSGNHIYFIRTDPVDSSLIYVGWSGGVDRLPFDTFASTLPGIGLPVAVPLDMVIDPTDAAVMYLKMYVGGTYDAALYKSVDTGDNWAQAFDRFTAMAIGPTGTLYIAKDGGPVNAVVVAETAPVTGRLVGSSAYVALPEVLADPSAVQAWWHNLMFADGPETTRFTGGMAAFTRLARIGGTVYGMVHGGDVHPLGGLEDNGVALAPVAVTVNSQHGSFGNKRCQFVYFGTPNDVRVTPIVNGVAKTARQTVRGATGERVAMLPGGLIGTNWAFKIEGIAGSRIAVNHFMPRMDQLSVGVLK